MAIVKQSKTTYVLPRPSILLQISGGLWPLIQTTSALDVKDGREHLVAHCHCGVHVFWISEANILVIF